MVALRSSDLSSFFKKADPTVECVLVYGTDAGQVSETARLVATKFADFSDPPGEIIRIEDADLDDDRDRLAIELRTMQMFGGPKIVRTTASRRITSQTLKPLVNGDLTGRLVVEAGSLRPDDALRTLFEKSARAAAIACYADGAGDLERLVREILGANGQTISGDAKQLLLARLGADRALSRAEIEKLSLYSQGRKTIEVPDIEAIVGDASEQTIDRIVESVAAGKSASAITEFDRAMAAGDDAQFVIASIQRHFHRLHRIRAAIDAGQSFDEATRALRPPIFAKQKATLQTHVGYWTLDRLTDARARITRAALAARRSGEMAELVAERLLIELSALAALGRRKASALS